ncbi:hypothetical protein, partial [Planococcus citreus]|uniref:hypothetical protein n=1 Tax=Planococcus citreus TaxID=1373 RepID=UPI0019D604AE
MLLYKKNAGQPPTSILIDSCFFINQALIDEVGKILHEASSPCSANSSGCHWMPSQIDGSGSAMLLQAVCRTASYFQSFRTS